MLAQIKKDIVEIDQEFNDPSTSTSRKRILENRKKKKQEQIDYNNNLLKLKRDELLQFYQRSEWKTFQISDHLPLWVEIDTDRSDEYLKSIL